MLAEGLAALAAMAGPAVVSAMAADGWVSLRKGLARVLARGDQARADSVEERLERSRTLLEQIPAGESERARAEQETVWRTRLADLLEEHPEVEGGLRAWVEQVQQVRGHSAGPVTQQVTGYDQAQQAVQGHGVQNVKFGDRDERP